MAETALEPTVRTRVEGPRATISWHRPPANVFTRAMLDDLTAALGSKAARSGRVVVLESRDGPWGTGLDVRDHLRPQVAQMLASFRAAARALWDVPGPTVAKIRGHCLGGGLELASMCDLAWASSNARFGQPEIRLGVLPPLAAAWFHRDLGRRRTAELLLLGETLSAAEARTAGLVNRVVEEGELDAAVDKVAAQLASYRPQALRSLKKTLRQAHAEPWPALERAERVYADEILEGPDAEEGLHAFLEKRSPNWEEC